MGKSTGFIEFDRETNPASPELERIKHWREFHEPLSKKERQEQGARCMNCGVPFCQSAMKLPSGVSGCPLHNLIPEWNDEVYQDNWDHALSRLMKTNNFPEFTSRVCPALCEAACTCGLYGDPVTVKENEMAIIEYGYSTGKIKPRIPEQKTDKRVAVIGSGPAGLAVADELNKRGHNVTVYERDDRVGGLLMYGIPNMKLEKHIIERRIDIMRKEGVEFITKSNIGKNVKAEKIMDSYDAVALCCGAKNPRDLNVPGRDAKGIYFAVDFLSSTTKALLNGRMQEGNFISAKGKKVVIVGGGDTGNDCVGTCIRHGCESVIQLEMMPKAPDRRTPSNPWPEWPRVCKTDYGQEEAIAVFGHDPRIYQTTVKEIIADDDGNLKAVVTVKLEAKKDPESGRMMMTPVEGSEETLAADILLIAAGFTGCEPYVAEAFGVETNARNNVVTENEKYHTSHDKIFCAGDMHRGQSLVVWAITEGRNCAREIDKFLMGYTNLV